MFGRALHDGPGRLGLRIALAAGIALAAPAASRAAEPAPSPRATMHDVFEALATLLPISATQQGFADPASRAKSKRAVEELVSASQALRDHAEARDADFLDQSRGLADAAESVRLAFQLQQWDDARMEVQLLTQRCIDCHSRLPDPKDAALSARWLQRVGLDRLPAQDRARLYVATRRFDDALDTWEGLFRDPKVAPFEMDVSGWIADYLTVALRVKRDAKRPRAALDALAERGDTPLYLQSRLHDWSRDLAGLWGPEVPGMDPVERGRALAERGRAETELPTAREGLVHDLAASAILLQWVDTAARPGSHAKPAHVAEAWYLLGLLDDRIAYASWVPRTEVFMEAALRADPGGRLARRAYDRVEEAVLYDYGAPNVAELPATERQRMTGLEAMIHD